MINKYRVHEVAKDFDVKSTVIVDLLLQYFPDTKKHMTVLEEEELDIIFDTFTTEHAVETYVEEILLTGGGWKSGSKSPTDVGTGKHVMLFQVGGAVRLCA